MSNDSVKDGNPVACVFCGSRAGNKAEYIQAAEAIGATLAKSGYKMVYGGGTIGLMGAVAKTFVANAGPDRALGIIPKPLIQFEAANTTSDHRSPEERASEVAKTFGRQIEVNDMHERKLMMAQQVVSGGPGSGFIVLPGGWGTNEECLEMTTWNQLGLIERGVVLFNVEGFFNKLLEFAREEHEAGFISANNLAILQCSKDAEGVIETLKAWKPSPDRMNLQWNVIKS